MNDSVTTKRPRSSGIDAFRLLSALPVIAAHGGRFGHFHEQLPQIISVTSKWSVPFFFIVLGYFQGKNTDKNRAISPMIRIAIMFALASLLMLPMDFAKDGVQATLLDLSHKFLISGGHFHLWFLSSLIMGLIVLRICDELEIKGLHSTLACVALLGAIVLGSYSSNGMMHFGRHLSSIAFLWVGIVLSRRSLSMRQSVVLLVAGLAIQFVEMQVLQRAFGKDLTGCPILIGTMPYAVGIFGVASNLKNSQLTVLLGKLGSRYTGCIYVTHVYFLWLVSAMASAAHVLDSGLYAALVVPVVFALALGTLLLIDRGSPLIIDSFLGDAKGIRGLVKKAAGMPRALLPVRALSR